MLLSVCRWSCCFAVGEEEFSSSHFELSYREEPSLLGTGDEMPACAPCVDLETVEGIFPPAVCCASPVGFSLWLCGFIPGMRFFHVHVDFL